MHFSDQDIFFMESAMELARESFLKNEVPVGAVVVKENKIIGRGRNTVIADNDVSSHAEINALRSASKELNNFRLNGCSIYVTLEPCHMCCMAIVNARIDNLFFGAKEPKTGAVVSVDNFFKSNFLNHKVSFSGGYMEKESELLLKNFFASKR